MIVCPNCNHQNPDAAVQCEACYTPLPAMTSCPDCGATVQSDASFCGQCGFNLKSVAGLATTPSMLEQTMAPGLEVPDLLAFDDPLMPSDPSRANVASPPVVSEEAHPTEPIAPLPLVSATAATSPIETASAPYTKLQVQTAHLIHVRTNRSVEIPQHLAVVHIGKPNERIPPDVDVSGFPDSEVVSRVHADIRVEAGIYYIEDMGSSNGTYINNVPLPMGNRHRLRPGDRIALGKGDKVSFLFQLL